MEATEDLISKTAKRGELRGVQIKRGGQRDASLILLSENREGATQRTLYSDPEECSCQMARKTAKDFLSAHSSGHFPPVTQTSNP